MRRRSRGIELLLFRPHPYLSRKRQVLPETKRHLQHRAGGARPGGRHDRPPHALHGYSQHGTPHRSRRTHFAGTDAGHGGRCRRCRRHDPLHASRTGTRHGPGRARLRSHRRTQLRLLRNRGAGRQVGHLHPAFDLAHRAGYGDDRRTGHLLHPGADRQMQGRGQIQGNRRLRSAGRLPRFRRHPHRGRRHRHRNGQPHDRRRQAHPHHGR